MPAVHTGGRDHRADELHGDSPLSRRRRRPLAGALGLLGFTVALRRRVADGPLLPGERWALDHRLLAPYDLPRVRRLIRGLPALGSPRVATGTVALAAVVLGRRVSRRAGIGVLLSVGVVPATRALKHRGGPTPQFLESVDRDALAANYPSGHVAYATAVFGHLGVVAHDEGHPVGAALAALVLAAVGPARALDGSHLPSDVLGGYGFGGAWLLFTIAVTRAPGG